MFARFRGFGNRLKRRQKDSEVELTVENSGLRKEQIDMAYKALRILGIDAYSSTLTKQDFIIFLYAMGLNPTEDMIDSKVRTFRLHKNTTFTFGQLAHIWHSMLQDLTDEEEILKRAFQFFDKDGNGEISVVELRTTMHELGDLLTEEEIISFMEIMDVNNDGVIGYHEFLNTLKTHAPELNRTDDEEDEEEQEQEGAADGGEGGGSGREGSVAGPAATAAGTAAGTPHATEDVGRGPFGPAAEGMDSLASVAMGALHLSHYQQQQRHLSGAVSSGHGVSEAFSPSGPLPLTPPPMAAQDSERDYGAAQHRPQHGHHGGQQAPPSGPHWPGLHGSLGGLGDGGSGAGATIGLQARRHVEDQQHGGVSGGGGGSRPRNSDGLEDRESRREPSPPSVLGSTLDGRPLSAPTGPAVADDPQAMAVLRLPGTPLSGQPRAPSSLERDAGDHPPGSPASRARTPPRA